MEEIKIKELSAKINDIKSRKARAEGAMERLYDQLKNEFGCTTVEEATDKQKKLEATIADDKKTLDDLTKKIESIVGNWSVI